MATENNSLQQRYRLEAREWLAGNMAPLEERELFATLHWMPSREKEDQHHLDCQQRQGKLYEAGYAGITVPKEYGGLELGQTEYARALELMARYDGSLVALISAHQSIGLPQPLKLGPR